MTRLVPLFGIIIYLQYAFSSISPKQAIDQRATLPYTDNHDEVRTLLRHGSAPTLLLCRTVLNKGRFCGNNTLQGQYMDLSEQHAASCKDRRLSEFYHASNCLRGRQVCPKPALRVNGARLIDTRNVRGVMTARYLFQYCHLDESSCGTLVSRCLNNGTWTLVKPSCCVSRLREGYLRRKPGAKNVSVAIPWGFGPGSRLSIIGIPTAYTQFSINLMRGRDRLLHIAVRFHKHGDNEIIVLDRYIDGYWQGDKKTYDKFPFQVGKLFVITLLATKREFVVKEHEEVFTKLSYGGMDGSETERVNFLGSVRLRLVQIFPNYFPEY